MSRDHWLLQSPVCTWVSFFGNLINPVQQGCGGPLTSFAQVDHILAHIMSRCSAYIFFLSNGRCVQTHFCFKASSKLSFHARFKLLRETITVFVHLGRWSSLHTPFHAYLQYHTYLCSLYIHFHWRAVCTNPFLL